MHMERKENTVANGSDRENFTTGITIGNMDA